MKLLLVLMLLAGNVFAQEESSSDDWGHYLMGGFDIGNIATFTGGKSDSSSSTFDTEMEFETGFSIGYEYKKFAKNDWGNSFGITYHTERDVDNFTLDGTKYSSLSDPASISVLRLYANLIYRWNEFYMPFGLNIQSITYNAPSNYSGSIDAKGGLGINFAIGWAFNNKISAEYGVYSGSFSLESDTTDYGTGALAISSLRLIYRVD